MVEERRLSRLCKSLFVLCFLLQAFVTLALLLWVLFAGMASGLPVTSTLRFRELLLVAMFLALIGYFKWPWIASFVGWIDIGMISAGLFAREETGLTSFFLQFSFDILFFVAAQVGFGLFLLQKKQAGGIPPHPAP